jgi:hypothetical protein
VSETPQTSHLFKEELWHKRTENLNYKALHLIGQQNLEFPSCNKLVLCVLIAYKANRQGKDSLKWVHLKQHHRCN